MISCPIFSREHFLQRVTITHALIMHCSPALKHIYFSSVPEHTEGTSGHEQKHLQLSSLWSFLLSTRQLSTVALALKGGQEAFLQQLKRGQECKLVLISAYFVARHKHIAKLNFCSPSTWYLGFIRKMFPLPTRWAKCTVSYFCLVIHINIYNSDFSSINNSKILTKKVP